MGKSLIIPGADFSQNAIQMSSDTLFIELLNSKQKTESCFGKIEQQSEVYTLFTNTKVLNEIYPGHIEIPLTNPISLSDFLEYNTLIISTKDNNVGKLFTCTGFKDQASIYNEGSDKEGIWEYPTTSQNISIANNKLLTMFFTSL